ncbi:MAG: site-specific DNA-methyltransferase [Spirochaetes bacterium]|nr:site-specific DNA-methyltransferase [Spirochaetota bacterium]
MRELQDESIHLIVTSPPYPMIAMWDAQFTAQDSSIGKALEEGDGMRAFERMHLLLDQVWRECYRVLAPGGFLCINIGDATRTVGGEFQLYSNHSRITEICRTIGFTVLPLILWRKTTNAPNKFMGSGMFPAGAYVTLEHEYILIFRKGGKRQFLTSEVKKRRQESAFFWEERNRWFVDLWELSGVRQDMDLTLEKNSGEELPQPLVNTRMASRSRSAAFPIELAYRLILMYSLREDWVLDPFLGTGTTLVAAAITGRNGVGYEMENRLLEESRKNILGCQPVGVKMLKDRLQAHRLFMSQWQGRQKKNGKKKELSALSSFYWNPRLQVPVVTKQETHICLEYVKNIKPLEGENPSGATAFEVIMRPFSVDALDQIDPLKVSELPL